MAQRSVHETIFLNPEVNTERKGKKRLPARHNNTFSVEEEALYVQGYACRIMEDGDMADFLRSDAALVSWNGDENLKIDRYDVRHFLDDLSVVRRRRGKQDATGVSEEELNEERYRDLTEVTDGHDIEYHVQHSGGHQSDSHYANVPFTYGHESGATTVDQSTQLTHDAGGHKESQHLEGEKYFRPPFDVPEELCFPPTQKLHQIMAHTAKFVIGNGGQAEIVLRVKQANNPNFAFLMPEHPLYPYFRFLISHPENVLGPPPIAEGEKCFQKAKELNAISLLEATYGEDEDDEDAAMSEKQAVVREAGFIEGEGSEAQIRATDNNELEFVILKNQKEDQDKHVGLLSAKVLDSTEANRTNMEDASRSHAFGDLLETGRLKVPAADSSDDLLSVGEDMGEEPLPPGTEEPGPPMGNVYSENEVRKEPSIQDQRIIAKMVEFIARNGKEFEGIVRERDKTGGRFPFLVPSHEWHWFYLQLLTKALQEGENLKVVNESTKNEEVPKNEGIDHTAVIKEEAVKEMTSSYVEVVTDSGKKDSELSLEEPPLENEPISSDVDHPRNEVCKPVIKNDIDAQTAVEVTDTTKMLSSGGSSKPTRLSEVAIEALETGTELTSVSPDVLFFERGKGEEKSPSGMDDFEGGQAKGSGMSINAVAAALHTVTRGKVLPIQTIAVLPHVGSASSMSVSGGEGGGGGEGGRGETQPHVERSTTDILALLKMATAGKKGGTSGGGAVGNGVSQKSEKVDSMLGLGRTVEPTTSSGRRSHENLVMAANVAAKAAAVAASEEADSANAHLSLTEKRKAERLKKAKLFSALLQNGTGTIKEGSLAGSYSGGMAGSGKQEGKGDGRSFGQGQTEKSVRITEEPAGMVRWSGSVQGAVKESPELKVLRPAVKERAAEFQDNLGRRETGKGDGKEGGAEGGEEDMGQAQCMETDRLEGGIENMQSNLVKNGVELRRETKKSRVHEQEDSPGSDTQKDSAMDKDKSYGGRRDRGLERYSDQTGESSVSEKSVDESQRRKRTRKTNDKQKKGRHMLEAAGKGAKDKEDVKQPTKREREEGEYSPHGQREDSEEEGEWRGDEQMSKELGGSILQEVSQKPEGDTEKEASTVKPRLKNAEQEKRYGVAIAGVEDNSKTRRDIVEHLSDRKLKTHCEDTNRSQKSKRSRDVERQSMLQGESRKGESREVKREINDKEGSTGRDQSGDRETRGRKNRERGGERKKRKYSKESEIERGQRRRRDSSDSEVDRRRHRHSSVDDDYDGSEERKRDKYRDKELERRKSRRKEGDRGGSELERKKQLEDKEKQDQKERRRKKEARIMKDAFAEDTGEGRHRRNPKRQDSQELSNTKITKQSKTQYGDDLRKTKEKERSDKKWREISLKEQRDGDSGECSEGNDVVTNIKKATVESQRGKVEESKGDKIEQSRPPDVIDVPDDLRAKVRAMLLGMK